MSIRMDVMGVRSSWETVVRKSWRTSVRRTRWRKRRTARKVRTAPRNTALATEAIWSAACLRADPASSAVATEVSSRNTQPGKATPMDDCRLPTPETESPWGTNCARYPCGPRERFT